MSGWHRPDVERSALDHLAQVVGPTSARQMIDGLLAKGRAQRDAEVAKLQQQLAAAHRRDTTDLGDDAKQEWPAAVVQGCVHVREGGCCSGPGYCCHACGDAPSSADRVVAWRSPGGRLLRCLKHVHDLAGVGFVPVTAEDLPDGGICTYLDCGMDVLITLAGGEGS